MFDFEDKLIGIVTLVALGLFVGGVFSFNYYFDRAKCYDMARNYEASVEEYSFLKDYCFVTMPNGETVNLDNYRDTNLTE